MSISRIGKSAWAILRDMKKILPFLCLCLLVAFLLGAYGCAETVETEDFLRIHIRADSNDPSDQAVKLKVRDAVVQYLTPILQDVPSKEEAKNVVKTHLTEIRSVARSVLYEYGFLYGAKVSVKKEEFPTKTYGDMTLLAGVYDAIVIELGKGSGDNWWCIAYPTFCFMPGQETVVYRSKIKELYDQWRQNGKK